MQSLIYRTSTAETPLLRKHNFTRKYTHTPRNFNTRILVVEINKFTTDQKFNRDEGENGVKENRRRTKIKIKI